MNAISRRRFVRLTALGLVGVPMLLEACAAPAPTTAVPAPTGNGAGGGRARTPTYVPFNGPAPDLSGTPEGVDAGYFTYPRNLVKSVTDVPGRGDEVTAITNAILQAPVAMEQNAAWLAVNQAMGATFKIILVPTGDYPQKLNTVIASGDIPDLLYNVHSIVANAPDFMRTQCADLTPFLSGDAVKDYPNLANMPPACWKQTVFTSGRSQVHP